MLEWCTCHLSVSCWLTSVCRIHPLSDCVFPVQDQRMYEQLRETLSRWAQDQNHCHRQQQFTWFLLNNVISCMYVYTFCYGWIRQLTPAFILNVMKHFDVFWESSYLCYQSDYTLSPIQSVQTLWDWIHSTDSCTVFTRAAFYCCSLSHTFVCHLWPTYHSKSYSFVVPWCRWQPWPDPWRFWVVSYLSHSCEHEERLTWLDFGGPRSRSL